MTRRSQPVSGSHRARGLWSLVGSLARIAAATAIAAAPVAAASGGPDAVPAAAVPQAAVPQAPVPPAAVPQAPVPPQADNGRFARGELVELVAFPSRVELRGAHATARVVVTGVDAAGGARDLTHEVAAIVADAAVARVDDGLIARPLADGETVLCCEHSGLAVEVPIVVVEAGRDLPLSFPNDIVPVFSKLACNSGGCHGKSGGQNGFQLSLFGFTPAIDYESLLRQSRGRRVFPAHPEHSLLLLKATGAMPHGGGALLAPGAPEHELLVRWIGAGLPWGGPDDPAIRAVEVYPRHRALLAGKRQQLVVIAVRADGSREDVTRLAEYSVSEDDYLSIDRAGRVTAGELPGSGAVLVRFNGRVDSFRVTLPTGVDVSDVARPAASSAIDEHVLRRLDELGIAPSRLCDDSVFLRRAFLAVCGTLPSTDEVERFLADEAPEKRARLIDDLLARDEYAGYFALVWADLLRNRREQNQAAPLTIRFRDWIHDQLLRGVRYDELVRQVLCAEGTIADSPSAGWYRQLDNAKKLVDDTAQVFLGTRIQCARCHHHPHEKWSQEDYWRFASFFSRVKTRNRADSRDFLVALERRPSRLTDDEETSASFRKSYDVLQPPGGPVLAESLDEDPRQLLVDWMVRDESRLLARALVNRYWKHFFGRGIVEPEDDLRETNPASNPALLDTLAEDFVASGWDLRWLVRAITTSTTFQLSAEPNDLNAKDRQSFSRFWPRRMSAEVALDAIDRVLDTSTRFDGMRRGARAIELPDEGARNYFLDVFGKPQRATACACERSADVTLSQVLVLLNSRAVTEKIGDGSAPPARFVSDDRAEEQKIRELFLRAFARPPRDDELERARAYLDESSGGQKTGDARRRAWEDLVWVLLNSKEFLFIR